MDFDDIYDDDIYDDDNLKTDEKEINLEIEESNSKYERETYINRNLIFSDRYISAIKSLGENRNCSRLVLDAARTMTNHHHGDKYEDLYFIDSVANKCKERTDYRVRPQEVFPTEEMKEFAKDNPNIISMHNHPLSSLPSFRDVSTCKDVGYKYGLIICHNGNIYQYTTTGKDINKAIYESEINAYTKDEIEIFMNYNRNMVNKNDLVKQHNQNFIRLTNNLLDAGVILREVLWDADSKGTGYHRQG